MSHNSSQKSSQSQPSSQQTVSSDPSSQQTLSETSSRNSSQSSQPQVTFQQRTQRPTNNSPRRTNSRQRGFQPRTRGRPITRTYRGYPYSLTVDLPPREDVSSQKQPQLDLPPSREDISSQQLQLDLPLRETFFPRNSCNLPSPRNLRWKGIGYQSRMLPLLAASLTLVVTLWNTRKLKLKPVHNSHNSNLLLRSLVTFTNHIHVSLPS